MKLDPHDELNVRDAGGAVSDFQQMNTSGKAILSDKFTKPDC